MISFKLRPAARARAETDGDGRTIDAAKLAQRIRDGDAAGIAAFYQAVHAGIRVLYRHHLPAPESEAEAEAEVRATFSATVQAIGRGELRDPEQLWRFARDFVRRRIEERGPRHAAAGGDEALRAEQAEVMSRVLRELSQAEREVLLRYYVRNEPVPEICGATGLTPSEVRALTTKVRDRFAELKNRGCVTRCPGE